MLEGGEYSFTGLLGQRNTVLQGWENIVLQYYRDEGKRRKKPCIKNPMLLKIPYIKSLAVEVEIEIKIEMEIELDIEIDVEIEIGIEIQLEVNQPCNSSPPRLSLHRMLHHHHHPSSSSHYLKSNLNLVFGHEFSCDRILVSSFCFL